MNRFTTRMPDDFHLHLRTGEMLRNVLPHTARHFKRATIMPNTVPPVLNADDLVRYHKEILAAALDEPGFEPLMTIQILETTTPETVFKAHEAGAVAGKIYPRGMTTNSANGVYNYRNLRLVLEAMEECGMLALFHGESPDPEEFCLDREVKFLFIMNDIMWFHSRLKIVMEHITTAKTVE
jgi:dihydroorotase